PRRLIAPGRVRSARPLEVLDLGLERRLARADDLGLLAQARDDQLELAAPLGLEPGHLRAQLHHPRVVRAVLLLERREPGAQLGLAHLKAEEAVGAHGQRPGLRRGAGCEGGLRLAQAQLDLAPLAPPERELAGEIRSEERR